MLRPFSISCFRDYARGATIRAMMRIFTLLIVAMAAQASQAPRQNAFAPDGTPIGLGLAGYAKVLCSAVFVSGREPAEAFENSGFFLFPEDQRRGVTYDVDRDKKR